MSLKARMDQIEAAKKAEAAQAVQTYEEREKEARMVEAHRIAVGAGLEAKTEFVENTRPNRFQDWLKSLRGGESES